MTMHMPKTALTPAPGQPYAPVAVERPIVPPADIAAAPEALEQKGPGPLVRLLDALLTWQDRARERHLLAEMPEQQLKDLGLTRSAVQNEIYRRAW